MNAYGFALSISTWLIVTGLAWGQSDPQGDRVESTADESAKVPKLVVEQAHVDLGVVRQGGIYDFSYLVTNRGKSNLLIRRIRSMCGCTVTKPNEPQLLKPGEQMTVHASFDSAGRVGPQRKKIEVYSNDPAKQRTVLSFAAEVEAVYQLRPNIQLLRFQNKRRGETLRSADHQLNLLAGKKNADLEILSVDFATKDIAHAAEPIEERGYNGYRLTLTLGDDAAIGPYENQMRIKLRCDEEEDELVLPIVGRVISDITVQPPYLLEVAPVLPGEKITYGRVMLQAVRRDKTFRIHKVVAGSHLTHAIEETQPGLEYRITFSVAPNAPKGPLATNILIFTNSSDQPVIAVPVYVNVGSPVEVRPAIVYLRRGGDSENADSVVVQLNSHRAADFAVERVSSDNPNFEVSHTTHEPRPGSAVLTIRLAQSAVAGEYEGTVTVFTNQAGAKTLVIPVYAQVVEEH